MRQPVNAFTALVGLIARSAQVPVQTVIIESTSGFLGKGWPLFRRPSMPITYRVRLGRQFAPPDDVRAFTMRRDAPLAMYGSEGTLDRISKRFPYIFDERVRPLPGTSKPEGQLRPLAPGETREIGDITVTAIEVPMSARTARTTSGSEVRRSTK